MLTTFMPVQNRTQIERERDRGRERDREREIERDLTVFVMFQAFGAKLKTITHLLKIQNIEQAR